MRKKGAAFGAIAVAAALALSACGGGTDKASTGDQSGSKEEVVSEAAVIEAGAWAVVVGTAIMHPTSLTTWFKEAVERAE